ncbi:hypothetical protein [Klebsiella pneumoniae IS10]|uniref:Uncharacterized protein n=1 Tax=Klebsiella pneumoniae IS43 TaxID=1432552 RepID=W1DU55_KLEPN|nr:hypothetical protein P244_2521 [Klebsiella pneumoniae HK787]CDK68966.1 hypothetical protein [Klebsiella pneumoniae IS10]CDK70141.1 hypothetical protein [Klebsiella pneumoniae IS22]CDK96192.1 hypothetical protein [Klebsiella pneumoniae IS33]CDL12225.1 hypothetical protein [Klebsiella pneumoniae IS43]CDL60924.1 hypothetical protein [Klebsiella pneumoniae IS39]
MFNKVITECQVFYDLSIPGGKRMDMMTTLISTFCKVPTI